MSRRNAFIAINRFGLGARPGELNRIAGDPRGWLENQITATAAPREFQNLPPASESAKAFFRSRRQGVKAIRRAYKTYLRKRYFDEINSRALAHIRSQTPFAERMVAFWGNHFTVSAKRFFISPMAGAYEREAIRPHIFGRFEDMLLAAVRHPAMLLYLDNAGSVGPNSIAGRIIKRGLNENLAREILELHTLGVGGGYSQNDVTEFARILTGWSVGGIGKRQKLTGVFNYVGFAHEPGSKTLLGKRYTEAGEAEGTAALKALARHPSTARFLATKLARHFIADDPPKDAIRHLERRFLATDGDLAEVAKTLIRLAPTWREPLAKVKTGYEYAISIFRALGVDRQPRKGYLPILFALGHVPFTAPSPKGWPDRAGDWIAPESLMRRIELARAMSTRLPRRINPGRFVESTIAPIAGVDTRRLVARAPSTDEAMALLFSSPEFQRR